MQLFNSLKKNKGQMLPIGIIGLTIISILIFQLFNRAETHRTKIRASNIADAAAYSGLAVQARTMNYLSITNRAMVANQVSIGQIVSLSSWLEYTGEVAINVGTVTIFIPYVNAISTPLIRAGQLIQQSRNLLPPLMTLISYTNGALSVNQTFVIGLSIPETFATMNQVINAFNSGAQLTRVNALYIETLSAYFSDFLQYNRSISALDVKADMIQNSRDEWVTNRYVRSGSVGLPGIGDAWFEKNGTTQLSRADTTWEWGAKDVGSIVYEEEGLFGDDISESPRLGDAYLTLASERPQFGGSRRNSRLSNSIGSFFGRSRDIDEAQYYNRAHNHNAARRWTNLENIGGTIRRERINTDYLGVLPYYSLAGLEDAETDVILELPVEIQIPMSRLNLQDTTLLDRSTSERTNEEIRGISNARLFFQRTTPREDGRIEYSNLFSPYWQVRLSNFDTQRNATRIIMGGRSLISEIWGG